MIKVEINPNAVVLPIQPVNPQLSGTITIKEEASAEGDDVFATGATPDASGRTRSNMSIQQDQKFVVEFDWNWQSGRFLDDSLTGGSWRCAALFEAMGTTSGSNPAADFNTAGRVDYGDRNAPVPMGTPNSAISRDYTVTIPVNPNPIATGLFRVSARAQYFDANGNPGALSFFEDLGMIHVYSDGSAFV